MHSKLSRVLVDHRKTQDRTPPLWFTEGLAEYWSTEWDTQAEMVMRDATLNDIVVGVNDMDRIFGSFLMYKEGQNVLQYIGKTYGEEKIVLLLQGVQPFFVKFLVVLPDCNLENVIERTFLPEIFHQQ